MRVTGILVATALAGCAMDVGSDDDSGGNGKADGNNTCDLPQYGDGTCQIDLACDVPDIDCFVTFDTDAAAAAWVGDIRGPAIAETDPRFVRGRKLLDQAWDIYKAQVPVGKLADKRLALVVVDNPSSNAFVMPDPDGIRGGHVVVIHSGSLAEGGDSDLVMFGTLFHELQHLSGLHWLDEVANKVAKFYLAPEGSEPIGARQQNNARVKDMVNAWIKHALVAGPFVDARLGGVPILGDLHSVLGSFVLTSTVCATQAQGVSAVYTELNKHISGIDSHLTIDDATVASLTSAFTALADCWRTNNQPTLEALIAPYPYIADGLTPAEKIDAQSSAVDAIGKIVAARRAAMRMQEEQFATELSRPWAAARYFSYEEMADDTSARVLAHAGMDVKGAAEFFLAVLEAERPACESAIASKSVPYGLLDDPHHGTCWRYAHQLQLIATPATTARTLAPADDVREPHVPRPVRVRRPIE